MIIHYRTTPWLTREKTTAGLRKLITFCAVAIVAAGSTGCGYFNEGLPSFALGWLSDGEFVQAYSVKSWQVTSQLDIDAIAGSGRGLYARLRVVDFGDLPESTQGTFYAVDANGNRLSDGVQCTLRQIEQNGWLNVYQSQKPLVCVDNPSFEGDTYSAIVLYVEAAVWFEWSLR